MIEHSPDYTPALAGLTCNQLIAAVQNASQLFEGAYARRRELSKALEHAKDVLRDADNTRQSFESVLLDVVRRGLDRSPTYVPTLVNGGLFSCKGCGMPTEEGAKCLHDKRSGARVA